VNGEEEQHNVLLDAERAEDFGAVRGTEGESVLSQKQNPAWIVEHPAQFRLLAFLMRLGHSTA
jgi:hypothetical protein